MDEYERIDTGLGQAIGSWALDACRRSDGVTLKVDGPLSAPGMDPTWIVRMSAAGREAELFLFRGPHAEVSWGDLNEGEPVVHVEGYDDLTPQSITTVLERLLHFVNGG